MKIKTTIPVDYYTGVRSTTNGILEGMLASESFTQGCEHFGANYAYVTPEGAIIEKGAFTIEGAEIDALYDAIKGDIPEGIVGFRAEMNYVFHLAFRLKMAETFEIAPAEIEIVE